CNAASKAQRDVDPSRSTRAASAALGGALVLCVRPANVPQCGRAGLALQTARRVTFVVKLIQRQAVLFMLVGAMFLLPAAAWAAQPDEVLERLMTQRLDPEWFTPAFLNQAPIAQVEALIVQLTQALGPFEKVVEGEPQYLIYLRDGIVPAEIFLDPEGHNEGIFFHATRLRESRLDQLVTY